VTDKELYAQAFTLAWEHIAQMEGFNERERSEGYEPVKGKIYELMEAGSSDPLSLATEALAWFRDRSQVVRSTRRVLGEAE
jgi:hypothetical protein